MGGWLIDVLFSSMGGVLWLLSTQPTHPPTPNQQVIASGGSAEGSHTPAAKHVRQYATSFLHQTKVVCKRTFVAVCRNPATSVLQVLSFIISAVLLGAFFYGKLTDGPTAMQAHIGFCFMVSYMIIFSAITSLELFIQERSLFVHEKTSGFYRTSAYFIAKASQ